MKFGYTLSRTGTTYTTSSRLLNNGGYATGTTIYDSLMRPRQTQTPAAGTQGGRVLTDTLYDSRGLVVTERGPYFNTSPVDGNIFAPVEVQVPRIVRSQYDGATRPTVAALVSDGTEKWRTTTSYGGDRVHIDPPAGGIPTTQITDARGRLTELRRYKAPDTTGDYEALTYSYTPAGNLKTATDPGGSTWTYDYDIAGRSTSVTDPDTGTSTTTYDAADQVTSTTNANDKTTWHVYDDLGRPIEDHETSSGGTLLRSWEYDTLKPGLPTSSSSYYDGAAYTTGVTGYDDAGRPTGTVVTIPESEPDELSGTYEAGYTYNPDGTLDKVTLPTVPNLPNETLSYFYDDLGNPTRMGGRGSYVAGTVYSPYGEVMQRTLGQELNKAVWQTNDYDPATGRQTSLQVEQQNITARATDLTYRYDPAGNITEVTDTAGGVDRQCFNYDYAQRLKDAWTSTADNCNDQPSLAAKGTSPISYWHSYTYDADGNRATETQHGAAGTQVAPEDITGTYGLRLT